MVQTLPGDIVVLQICPVSELVPPLINRHAVGHQAENALANACRCCDAHQRFPCPTGQHNDACTGERRFRPPSVL